MLIWANYNQIKKLNSKMHAQGKNHRVLVTRCRD